MIRGEKTFTDKIRKDFVCKILKQAQKSEQKARRLRGAARAVEEATTAEELRRIKLGTGYNFDLLVYCVDRRKTCFYCGRKGHSGLDGLVLSQPERFCCWRKTCNAECDKDTRRDKRKNPKLYKVEERLEKAARRRARGWLWMKHGRIRSTRRH